MKADIKTPKFAQALKSRNVKLGEKYNSAKPPKYSFTRTQKLNTNPENRIKIGTFSNLLLLHPPSLTPTSGIL